MKINEDKYDIFIKGKTRLINPGVYVKGTVYTLSDLDSSIDIINCEAEKSMSKGVYIEIL
ncbi:hypothetical protein LZ906_008560 [Paraclostridium ghonii]|uniref:hypothetical protein n=1 Tax=Paraclostridium ghonii TaxID=29358 RepID=UPI00202CB7AE|nr:hypothetical protein [Paeniclostridium ghonii]MCM0167711.1 hypothetical protein [Paeniclostridium ghonii]